MFKYLKLITKDNKKFLLLGSFLTFFGSFFISFETFILHYITSSFDSSKTFSNYNGIIIALAIMFVCAILAIACNFSGIKFLTQASISSIRDYRIELFNKIQYLPYDKTLKYSPSSLINRITIDVNNIMQTLNFMIINGIPSLWSLIFYVVFSIVLVKYLSFLYILIFLVIMSITIIRGKKSTTYYDDYISNYDNLNEATKENILGYRVIKSFQLEEHQKKKFNIFNKNMEKFGIKGDGLLLTMISILLSITNFFTILILLFSGFVDYGLNGNITISEIIPFMNYVFLSTFAFNELLQWFTYSFKTNISFSRTNAILSLKIDDYEEKEYKDFIYGDIEFKNVYFKYDDSSKNVLTNINVKIKKDSFVCITGTIGSGKTTIIELLTKIIHPVKGKILLNNININDIDTVSLRKNIGYAMQNKMLFSGTIKDNILFGNEFASIQELNEAADISCSSSFIKNKENGFDFVLTEFGKNLSGGQQQRISIARAIAMNPKILILDDSLSALDNITSTNVLNNILEKFNKSIIILVTQKIDLLKKSSQTIVLENGKIEAIGKHNQLLKKSKTYKFINDSQKGI